MKDFILQDVDETLLKEQLVMLSNLAVRMGREGSKNIQHELNKLYATLSSRQPTLPVAVRYEDGVAAEEVATFYTEELYMKCLPILKADAKGHIIVESVNEF